MAVRAKKKRDLKDWCALVGVIISGVGLCWAVVAHFTSSAEPLPRQQAKPTMTVVTTNGAGSVGIVNGGQLTTTVVTLGDGASGKRLSAQQ
jgi:hypothetical protein